MEGEEGEVLLGRPRLRHVPIDDSHEPVRSPQAVPGREIAMADDLARANGSGAGPPHRVASGLERTHHLMEASESAGESGHALIGPEDRGPGLAHRLAVNPP